LIRATYFKQSPHNTNFDRHKPIKYYLSN